VDAVTGDVPPGLAAGLPDDTAREFYLAILAEGGRLPFADLTGEHRPALDQLIGTGLVMPNAVDGTYVAVSPRSVSERLCSEMRSEATRLLNRAEELPAALHGLTRAYDSTPRTAPEVSRPAYIDGRENIRQRIAELVSECRQELLAAQPGPRPPEMLTVSRRQDLALLRRGGLMRTIYQPLVLNESAGVAYAAAMTAEGAQVRVLDEPFQRMLIIDREVAVVPASDDHGRASFISDPSAVAFLIAVYERDWARAEAVEWSRLAAESPVQSAAFRVGRLLATGLTQRAVATRLGLSERTVAGHIARLRDRYGAQTLFQLGWQMRGGQRD
jgi:sugar-specific transcriptional regulator TrmB/DNA-binding CsgD family transcriptional regulator